MAKFAKIGINNKVISVEIIDDTIATNEKDGIRYLTELTKYPLWKQTFSDGTRNKQAGIGDTYNEELDVFITPKPYKSMTLNEETFQWEFPVANPNDGQFYDWNEDTQTWTLSVVEQGS